MVDHLEIPPIPQQYQVIETFSLNEATNINKVLRHMLVSKFPLTNPIKIPNCVIKSFPGFGYSTDENMNIFLKRGIFIITEVMIQTYGDVVLNLNNSNHYFDSKPSGDLDNKIIYLAAHYNHKLPSYRNIQFGFISDINTYNNDKDHYLLILDVTTKIVSSQVTIIINIKWNDEGSLDPIYTLSVADDGWIAPIPQVYIDANKTDPTIIPPKTTKIKLRRGNQFDVNEYLLEDGELVWGENTRRLKIGDGQNLGGIDILEGNVDYLPRNKYYGTDFNGRRGFHDIVFYYDVKPNDFSSLETCEIEYLNTFLPTLKFPGMVDSKCYAFIPFSSLKNSKKDINFQITYTLTGVGPEGENKKLKFLTKIWILFENYSIDFNKPSYLPTDDIIISSSSNIDKIQTSNLSNTFITSFLSTGDIRYDFIHNNISEGILIEFSRNGASDEFAGNFNLINFRAYSAHYGIDYGYNVGGTKQDSLAVDTIEAIHFPFDSGDAYVGSYVKVPVRMTYGLNSSTHGIIAGGNDSKNWFSTIQRLEFPFQSGRIGIVGNLTERLSSGGACNSSNSGYFCFGGNVQNELFISNGKIEKYIFSLEHSNSRIINDQLQNAHIYNCSAFNSSTHGFNVVGDRVRRITFSSESDSMLNLQLDDTGYESSMAYSGLSGSFNSSSRGFILGGAHDNYEYSLPVNTCLVFDFPFDTVFFNKKGNLTINRTTSGCNSSESGYVLGGSISGTDGIHTSTVEKIYFPFDSGNASLRGNLSTPKNYSSSFDGTDFVNLFI